MVRTKHSDVKPRIVVLKTGPLKVLGLRVFKDSRGGDIPASPVMFLCRCGASASKPFCDGSHVKVDFSSEKSLDRRQSCVEEYVGDGITILFDEGVCAFSENCVKSLPGVFLKSEPWIDPEGASVDEIVKVIENCPSGALSYRVGERFFEGLDRDPAIIVARNGPFMVVGGVLLEDEAGSVPNCPEQFTLCRCGSSKNKPFCDGSHIETGFKDD
jgi:CDGSH-type Zn-finger protein